MYNSLITLFSGLISLLIRYSVSAQQLTATPGSTGIYLSAGKQLPKTFRYRLDRSLAGQNVWSPIAELYFPRNNDEFAGRLNEAVTQLPAGPIEFPNRSLAMARYNLLRTAQTVDSLLAFSSVPHYQIAAGVGFWDATATANTAYDYRLTRLDGRNGATPTAGGETITRNVRYPGSYPGSTFAIDTAYANGPSATLEYTLISGRQPDVLEVYRAYYLQGGYQRVPATFYPNGTATGRMRYKVIDANVTDKLSYAYYIVPGDYLGNRGTPSPVYNLYNARQNQVTSMAYNFRVRSVAKERGLRLSWRVPPSREISSIDIFRGDDFDKTFVRLTSVGIRDTVFIDRAVDPVKTYFYTIVVNTVYGKTFPSARVPGILEGVDPNNHPPTAFAGRQKGRVVTLSWNRPNANIYGYYLYRSNRYNDPKPQQVGSILLSRDSVVTVTDTLPDQASDLWIYSAASVNTSYNLSALSERATFRGRTSTIQPPPDLTVRLRNNKVAHLIWTNMIQRGLPTQGFQLYRKETRPDGNVSDWQLLTKQPISPTTNFYADSTIQPGRSYRYAVRSVGAETGQLSDLSPEAGCTVAELQLASVRNLRAIQTGKSILIQWDAPFDPSIEQLVVYRCETGQPFQRLKQLSRTTTQFSDESPVAKRTYYYRIVSEGLKKSQSRNPDTVGIYVE